MAFSQEELRAILTLQDSMSAKLATIESALARLGKEPRSFGALGGTFAVGTIAAWALKD